MNRIKNYDDLTTNIVNWLYDYAKRAKVNGFVVGVSGGIDSAVVSKLCWLTRTLRTVCVTMPIHQQSLEQARAEKHIATLGKVCDSALNVNVDLTSVFDHFNLTLRSKASNCPLVVDKRDREYQDRMTLSSTNLRARMRMSALYHIATVQNLLVAGTGNKVEDFGVGFYTKYGDGGVDISPIAGLYKTEVTQLGRHLGIIDEILNAKPTDGLWEDGRTDEDQIGATYPELERAMDFVEKKPYYSPEDLEKLSEREREVLRIYRRRHDQNEHKMLPIPVFKLMLPVRDNV